MMIVRGLDAGICYKIAATLDLELDNERAIGRGTRFRLIPKGSQSPYSRKSPGFPYTGRKGRRLVATCYHGFRDYIRLLFQAGATSVQSTAGRWDDAESFDAALPTLARKNVGSIMYPAAMISLCQCTAIDGPLAGRSGTHTIRGRVTPGTNAA